MKRIGIIFFLFISVPIFCSIKLDYLRSNYRFFTQNKMLCDSVIKLLELTTNDNVQLGYLGALQTIWATHTFNPIEKLSTFNKGKKNIEKAINIDKTNIELRFLRLSIQKNCPKFLNYYYHIDEDEKMVKKNKNINNKHLELLILNYLKL